MQVNLVINPEKAGQAGTVEECYSFDVLALESYANMLL